MQPLEAPDDRTILENSFTSDEANVSETSIRAVVAPADCRFILTGGSDRKLRYWDMAKAENSSIILGLELDEPKPRYR